ncbi:MAG TPA: T9SS type A sorting domain-containing protein, partial [Bacteroidota bacterium]|nr:T9SS type A sorting domain-containing protein [Bacteroidota bacterium]
SPTTIADNAPTTTLLGRFLITDVKGTGYFPPAGTIIKVVTNKPVVPGVIQFVANTAAYAPTVNSTSLAKTAVSSINVFPNPYFGVNPQETDKYHRFVTISHLPAAANVKIRIFNLAGELVRSIVHNPASQFEQWDLNNRDGLPVAAGMYIILVQMPDLQVTKTLKLAVIPEQQYLDRY